MLTNKIIWGLIWDDSKQKGKKLLNRNGKQTVLLATSYCLKGKGMSVCVRESERERDHGNSGEEIRRNKKNFFLYTTIDL